MYGDASSVCLKAKQLESHSVQTQVCLPCIRCNKTNCRTEMSLQNRQVNCRASALMMRLINNKYKYNSNNNNYSVVSGNNSKQNYTKFHDKHHGSQYYNNRSRGSHNKRDSSDHY